MQTEKNMRFLDYLSYAINLMAKNTALIIACIVFICLVFDCGGDSSKEDVAEKSTAVGTYNVTDKMNTTYLITLKEDETGEIKVQGTNDVFYVSWGEETWGKGDETYIMIHYSMDYESYPKIIFPAGIEQGAIGLAISNDGWIYASLEYRSKNPKWRLKCNKIN